MSEPVHQTIESVHMSFGPVFSKSGKAKGSNKFVLLSLQMAALLTTPFDVIKTHRQMELGELVFSKLKQYLGGLIYSQF